MSDERPKRSWKEIDEARNRGIRFEKKVSKLEEREKKQASNKAKKELNALFSESKVSKEKAKRIEEIKSLRGKPAFHEGLTHYLKEFGIPLEFDVQMLMLDHRDSKVILDILNEIETQAPKWDLAKQDLLHSKLKVMSLSIFDSEILSQIERIQKAMLKI